MGYPSYDEYKQRLNIQDILVDAGYVRNRRDGFRYPSYVRLDGNGIRIRGDKFLVTPNRQCCFHPPVIRCYNIISFIKEHPDLFRDYTVGMNLDLLVNKVCCRLLNTPYEEGAAKVTEPLREPNPFCLENYRIRQFDGEERDCRREFHPYFRHRGIDDITQSDFGQSFVLASRTLPSGYVMKNLSFPLTIPGADGAVVGFEQRGHMRMDGMEPFKGMAEGSNASEGLWIASPAGTGLSETGHVLVFESAYDAMAYYQLHRDTDSSIREAVFVSTGGTPTVRQMDGLIRTAPSAVFHLCFDNDLAGKQFVMNFESVAESVKPYSKAALDFKNTPGNIEIDEAKEAAFDKLPDAVRKKYYVAYEKSEEYGTAYLCPEDKEEMKKEIREIYREFNRMVDDCIVTILREVPSDGYKDWNDELLGEMEETTKKAVGADFDGDGEIEIEESNEEKHHYHR